VEEAVVWLEWRALSWGEVQAMVVDMAVLVVLVLVVLWALLQEACLVEERSQIAAPTTRITLVLVQVVSNMARAVV